MRKTNDTMMWCGVWLVYPEWWRLDGPSLLGGWVSGRFRPGVAGATSYELLCSAERSLWPLLKGIVCLLAELCDHVEK